MCPEPKLKPRYHMTALQTLIDRHFFKEDALELANDIMASLDKQKKLTCQKNKKRPVCGKKTM